MKKSSQLKLPSQTLISLDSQLLAEVAGLEYVTDQMPGIQRGKKGEKFVYFEKNGKVIRDKEEIKRIQALAIPPAYQDVWICPNRNGHLQATGRDAKGRKQYRYHARWREVSDETKYTKMLAFGQVLPLIRKQVQADLALDGMPSQKILAVVVSLLESTLIRIGNEEYARDNHSFGLTTLQDRHVAIKKSKILFKFRGKSGQQHQISLTNSRLAKILKQCKDIPGQELFQYKNEKGEYVSISSTHVNQYLHRITNNHFTAKDFRTWAGTALAAFTLQSLNPFKGEAEAKKNIVHTIAIVSKKLGNTPNICRKCYIHPEILKAYV